MLLVSSSALLSQRALNAIFLPKARVKGAHGAAMDKAPLYLYYMNMIPAFPEWTAIQYEHKDILQSALLSTPDGVSEFTFPNLYLFRRRYDYHLSALDTALGTNNFIISGTRDGKKFFSTPFALPHKDVVAELFRTHDYWKNIPESIVRAAGGAPGDAQDGAAGSAQDGALGGARGTFFEEEGIEISEDRDNFDYLYLREDLAKLTGKKYHKKRNLVNAFLLAYPEHRSVPLTRDLVGEAQAVLEIWRIDKNEEGDYLASSEALAHFNELGMEGALYYVKDRPVGWCLGEKIARGKSFALHFEKAVDYFKGVYQFINQSFAESLPDSITWINREQDLGDDGLRQAKETYRPCGFVKKWIGKKPAP
jgi:hypothetical protein